MCRQETEIQSGSREFMKIAVLGATGLVGRTMLKLIEDRRWVTGDPVLLSSARGAGTSLPFRDRNLVCREVSAAAFEGVDIALFSAGGGPSRQWAPVAASAGAWVVDNSSAWRMDDTAPLVVPEINGRLVGLAGKGRGGIIANPNCSTIQIAMAVAPLDAVFEVTEAHVTTLQAVSGAGQAAVAEMESQEQGQAADPEGAFPRQIFRNAIPAIGATLDDGSYEEETKVVREMRKILGRGRDLAVTCTATRVPVVTGHSAAVRLVCNKPVDPDQAVAALENWPGVEVEPKGHLFKTPLEMAGSTAVHVGRLRRDPENPHALMMWVVADNLLKGAAWNAIQIADLLAGDRDR
jgi:aspartate-semialdehyde dehydrogenase